MHGFTRELAIDTDSTFAANSDSVVPSQKAVNTALDTKTNLRPTADSTTAVTLENAAGTAVVTIDTTNSRVGIGVTPNYSLDIKDLHIRSDGTDTGAYLQSVSASNIAFAGGAVWNGSAWVAKTTSAEIISAFSGGFEIDTNTGLTAGNTFTPSKRFWITSTGNVLINSAAVATNATDGFLHIPSCAGSPSGTPALATGLCPLVVDSTNLRLYVYVGGAWKYAALT